MPTRAVDANTFDDEVLRNERPVLVDFWAEWCGPCRALGPVLDQLADSLHDRLDVVKVNVDSAPQLAARYRVTSLPVLKIFRGGAVVHTITGAQPRAAIEEELAAHLG
ncbi:thioredoxin [Phytoactinopolyspora halotolerans]|uniref:Thioredoxin n=1 Tax=Phytoactinopolyspora halotolerans TaxID=1981512 RepID=A0A6L9S5X7_9ACTN|nr:thioredoxin [Phytoactinopolyspora halotolerans]NEE00447.1 thioredoxin [Phytoactinopolyspora halotolerans]